MEKKENSRGKKKTEKFGLPPDTRGVRALPTNAGRFFALFFFFSFIYFSPLLRPEQRFEVGGWRSRARQRTLCGSDQKASQGEQAKEVPSWRRSTQSHSREERFEVRGWRSRARERTLCGSDPQFSGLRIGVHSSSHVTSNLQPPTSF